MFIRSERLFLRPIWSEDWADLQAGLGDGDIAGTLWPFMSDKARDCAAMAHNPRLPQFLITCPRGNQGVEAVGVIGLSGIDGQAALGCWIARDHRGQGYATEAARAVLTLARTLGHNRMMARQVQDNPAAGRVLRKLGFSPIGAAEEFGSARGYAYALDLGAPSDCDDDLGGDGMGGDGAGRGGFPTRRAA